MDVQNSQKTLLVDDKETVLLDEGIIDDFLDSKATKLFLQWGPCSHRQHGTKLDSEG